MPTDRDDLFDAKLRAALGTPPVWSELEAAPAHAEETRRPFLRVAATILVTSALAYGVHAWFSDPPPAQESEVITQDKKSTEDAASTRELIQRLANPRTMAAARGALINRGAPVVPALLEELQRIDYEDATAFAKAMLDTLRGLRAAAKAAPPVLRKLMQTWPGAGCADLVECRAHLALFVPVEQAKMSLMFENLEVDGRRVPTGKRLTNRLMRATRSQRSRTWVQKHGVERAFTGDAGTREAALDLMLASGTAIDGASAIALEKVLLQKQPAFDHHEFESINLVRTRKVASEPALRTKAARLLIERAPTTKQAASAFAWRLRAPNVSTKDRRLAALTIGQLLAGEKIQNQVRREQAAAALLAAAKDKDPAVAGEAITVLPQLGDAGLRFLPDLKKLTKHADATVARRAQAAYATLRKRLDGK